MPIAWASSGLCVFMGMDFVYDPSPERLRLENDQVLGALRAFPERLFGSSI